MTNDPGQRTLFPQTVDCISCATRLPPAITVFVIGGHIYCQDCAFSMADSIENPPSASTDDDWPDSIELPD